MSAKRKSRSSTIPQSGSAAQGPKVSQQEAIERLKRDLAKQGLSFIPPRMRLGQAKKSLR